MKISFTLVIIEVVHFTTASRAFLPKLYPPPVKIVEGGDYGQPLFLTPYIDSGRIEEGRRKSVVNGLPGLKYPVKSYSGFLTVNAKYKSNLFFWFFPAKNPTAPVVVWLQGGPGGSSLFGLFGENGPLEVAKNLSLKLRKYTWTNLASMLYIDNPVGTGFSFTESDSGYATNEEMVANDLYEMLRQFFTIYPNYKKNEFYLTGESYAGKYIPALGYRIYVNNSAHIKFRGAAIGDGWSDPVTMLDYADYLYQLGLVDELQRDRMRQMQKQAVSLIKQGKFAAANKESNEILKYFTQCSGLSDPYNFLYTVSPVPEYYQNYLALPQTRKAIHVGNLTYNDGAAVGSHLINDIMQSVKPWVGVIMDNYRVMMYSGQLDIIVAAPLTENFLKTVEWKYADLYRRANRTIWKANPDDKEVAGYIRKVHNFTQVIVRNAGHMVPFDQPRAMYDLLRKFLSNSF